jgi:hypothetical protein
MTPKQPTISAEPSSVLQIGSIRIFPFQLKEGMKLAPLHVRQALTSGEHANFMTITGVEVISIIQPIGTSSLILEVRLSESGATESAERQSEAEGVRNAPYMTDNFTCKLFRKAAKLDKAKLFQFVDNRRPAYYGTSRRRCEVVSARRPFKHDSVSLHYSYLL